MHLGTHSRRFVALKQQKTPPQDLGDSQLRSCRRNLLGRLTWCSIACGSLLVIRIQKHDSINQAHPQRQTAEQMSSFCTDVTYCRVHAFSSKSEALARPCKSAISAVESPANGQIVVARSEMIGRQGRRKRVRLDNAMRLLHRCRAPTLPACQDDSGSSEIMPRRFTVTAAAEACSLQAEKSKLHGLCEGRNCFHRLNSTKSKLAVQYAHFRSSDAHRLNASYTYNGRATRFSPWQCD